MLKPDERSGQLNHTQQKLIIKITGKKTDEHRKLHEYAQKCVNDA